MEFDTAWKATQYGLLLHTLDHIRSMEQKPAFDYTKRYHLLIAAHLAALSCGIASGFRLDPKEPEWPVIFFELPTGQVSWHVLQHQQAWDGHTTAQKHERIRAVIEQERAADEEGL